LPSNVVAAQIVGAPIGLALLVTLYPAAARTADRGRHSPWASQHRVPGV